MVISDLGVGNPGISPGDAELKLSDPKRIWKSCLLKLWEMNGTIKKGGGDLEMGILSHLPPTSPLSPYIEVRRGLVFLGREGGLLMRGACWVG